MNPDALTPVLRVLRLCLHLLVLAMLGLAVLRAVTRQSEVPSVGAVVASASVMAAVYGSGSLVPRVRRSPRAAALWLAAVAVCWLVLLTFSADAVWLAFPLFFLQLHLLPLRPGLLAVAATTAAAVAGFGWHQHTFTAPMVVGPALGAAVAVATVLGYQALYRESDARRRLILELTETRAELAAAERAAGMLTERERLAREIHDTLAQGLSSIQLLLRAAERALPDRPDVAAGHVLRAREAAVDNLAEARRFVRDETPPGLDAGALPAALERLAAATTDAGVPTAVVVSAAPDELPTSHEVALLRVAQSALANVVQHASATRARVVLGVVGDEVRLEVADDGVGFDAQDVHPAGDGGFGLTTMRARAEVLHGTLTVESAPGRGTVVAVRLPRAGGAVTP
ncbi:Signal transduction histidine kinase [Georgenia satyanarayanai]|uniref:Oxygen sensor histidine kinase NreB n=1 Tax=Georgenia satyanarayanai TaxID=860221 RepID=A0A2Y9BWZ4_9MICO|nr:sensor histidine kinase [Georgenia satyanarayanai]PYG00543.1 signal transduction histidine kinase [Georgenia satyanarayanai]SSA39932.1 Signal transduction histidine kinase [Georgenia satyanarayanai]